MLMKLLLPIGYQPLILAFWGEDIDKQIFILLAWDQNLSKIYGLNRKRRLELVI